MPTKRLPDSANLDHLKHQAKDLLRGFRSGQMSAFQRVREFHPRFSHVIDGEMFSHTFSLSDAQLSIAREYGYSSWPRLKVITAQQSHRELHLTHNDRLPDGAFKQALDFMDAGDEVRLRNHLASHPNLINEKAVFEGDNYFTNPTLLEFLPENPNRQGSLPANAISIAKILLEAGAKHNLEALNETVILAASGRLCREAGLQSPVISLLCEYGADPSAGMHSALAHEEFEAARTLIDCGAALDLPTAATLDEQEAVERLVKHADTVQLQLALSLSAGAGRSTVVRMLLSAGANPNLYNPAGGHSHCTPLHSAVANNRFETVVELVEQGSDINMKDIHHSMTALGWARHLKHEEIANYLISVKEADLRQ